MRRFLWFSILLGTAVALFFGAAASPAYAHCKGKHSPPHEHCTLDTIFSLTTEGKYYYKVQGATIVDAKQAKALLDQGVVIIDMRGIGRWMDGHVKGALLAFTEVGEFTEENLAKLVKKTQPVVFYCDGTSSIPASPASAEAVIWGYEKVYYFAGGFPEWEEAGYPIAEGE